MAMRCSCVKIICTTCETLYLWIGTEGLWKSLIVINFNTAHCVGYDLPSTTDIDAALPETTETSTEPAVAQTTSVTPIPLKPVEPTTEEATTG